MQQDLINRLLLQVEDKLADLHLAVQMKDEQKQEELNVELQNIHHALRVLGHFPSQQKQKRERVAS